MQSWYGQAIMWMDGHVEQQMKTKWYDAQECNHHVFQLKVLSSSRSPEQSQMVTTSCTRFLLAAMVVGFRDIWPLMQCGLQNLVEIWNLDHFYFFTGKVRGMKICLIQSI